MKNLLTNYHFSGIIYTVKEETPRRIRGKCRKEKKMDNGMTSGEVIKTLAEENQTRKILDILNECKTIEEAKEKIRALLNNK